MGTCLDAGKEGKWDSSQEKAARVEREDCCG